MNSDMPMWQQNAAMFALWGIIALGAILAVMLIAFLGANLYEHIRFSLIAKDLEGYREWWRARVDGYYDWRKKKGAKPPSQGGWI